MQSSVPLPILPAPAGDPRVRPQAAALSALTRKRALEMGFDRVGIAPVHPSAHADAYDRWVALGMHGEMGYLSREDAVAKRKDPAALVPGAVSAVVVALDYAPAGDDPAAADDP